MSLDFDMYDDICPCCGRSGDGVSINITHNLAEMADALGCYKCLWRPEENSFSKARDIIEKLEYAINELKTNRKNYVKYDAPNGWGDTSSMLSFLSEVYEFAKEHPDATIEASR